MSYEQQVLGLRKCGKLFSYFSIRIFVLLKADLENKILSRGHSQNSCSLAFECEVGQFVV